MAIKKETVKKSKNLQQPVRHCMIKKGKYEYITFIILQSLSLVGYDGQYRLDDPR